MRQVILILLLGLSFSASANECKAELQARLTKLIENEKLTESNNTTNKHKKLTDHDYPVSCKTKYKESDYILHTDEKRKCIIVQESDINHGKYYGVYCI